MNRLVLLPAFAVLAAACATTPAPAPGARAAMAPTAGNQASGTVTFAQHGERVRMVARLSGLPAGPHGFHIHEKGDCSAPDATSAGGHFNPTAKPHGNPAGGEHHAGDVPMLVADASGNAVLDTTLAGVTLGGGATGLVGRAVVVHKDADDFVSQPAGNSGARIACGVIAGA